MCDIVISLLNVELSSVLFSLDIDLFQVQQMLVIKNINGLNLILKHFLLVFI